jgi:adenylate cyclase
MPLARRLTKESVVNPLERPVEIALPDDRTGWPLAPVVGWLFNQGRTMGDAKIFFEALCQRLLEVGAPVWRVRINVETINPQVIGLNWTWYRARGGVTEFHAPHEMRLSDDYVGSPLQALHQTGGIVRYRLDALHVESHHSVLHSLASEGGTDYVAMPLIFSSGTLNAFFVATDCAGGFCDADIAKFSTLASFLTPMVEVMALNQVVRSVLDTYVGPRTAEKVLKGLIKRGDGETIRAALWFSDLRDFTRLTESLPPERLLAMLNSYFEHVADAVTARGGEVLRFIGDAMLIVFAVDSKTDTKAACAAACDAADDAFARIASINRDRRAAAEPEIRFGLGLHVGDVIYGNVGAPNRLDFTVMGPAVNRTARLAELTKGVGYPLLLSAEFAAHIDRPLRSLGRYELRGVAEPQEVFVLA